MRRVTVVNTATATIEESWTLLVPDDMTNDAVAESWRDLLDHPKEFGAVIVSASDTVIGDEEDREFKEVYE